MFENDKVDKETALEAEIVKYANEALCHGDTDIEDGLKKRANPKHVLERKRKRDREAHQRQRDRQQQKPTPRFAPPAERTRFIGASKRSRSRSAQRSSATAGLGRR